MKSVAVDLNTWEINLIRYGFAGFVLMLVSFGFKMKDSIFLENKKKKSTYSSPAIFHISSSTSSSLSSSLSSKWNVPFGYHTGKQMISTLLLSSSSSENTWYRMPTMSVQSWITVSLGVFFVTFLCPALQSYALFEVTLALAITLNSTTPLYMLPLMWCVKREKPTHRGILGAFMSCIGVAILCIWGVDG